MIQLKNITKHYDTKTIFDHFNLTIEDNELVAIVGDSGSGKSTLLNAIAGIWNIDSGKISIDEDDITKLPDYKRAKYIGRVFQDPMTDTAATMQIEENMALAKRRGKKKNT